MFPNEGSEVDAEVREREVGDGNSARKVFEVDDGILELEELFTAVLQIVHLVARLLLDDVLLASSGDIEEHHAPADSLFEVDVFLELDVRPKVHELNAVVRRAQAVNASETLDDANGIPVNIVVDNVIAVLEVLALADAVRGDEEVELA